MKHRRLLLASGCAAAALAIVGAQTIPGLWNGGRAKAAPANAANDAISIVRSWERETAIRGGSSFGYDYVALAHKRHHKQMEPFVMVFPSRVDKDIRFEHQGEEFMFILSGKVEFEATIDGRNRTWILSPGDSAYFDAEIPHRGRSLRGESRALVVIYRSKDPV